MPVIEPPEDRQPTDVAGAEAAPAGPEAPEPPTPGAPPAPKADLIDRFLRQWAQAGRPKGTVVVLSRTIDEDPDAGPYLELIGVGPEAGARAHAAWEQAQLASDGTVLGRLLRPTVGLVGAGGRWIAARCTGRSAILEPIDHTEPDAALRAARERFALIVRGVLPEVELDDADNDWDAADEAVASGAITEDPAPDGVAETPAAGEAGDPATDPA